MALTNALRAAGVGERPTGRSGSTLGRKRGRPRPTVPPEALERPGIHVGPGFVGMDLDALRRVEQYTARLEGELLKSDGPDREERPERSRRYVGELSGCRR